MVRSSAHRCLAGALVLGGLGSMAPAFLATKRPQARAPATSLVARGSVAAPVWLRTPSAAALPGSEQASASLWPAAAAVLLVATGWSRSRKAAAAAPAPAFTGLSLQEADRRDSPIIRASITSCKMLWFRRSSLYGTQYQREVRNRAYNIFHKNRFRRGLRIVMRKIREVSTDKRKFVNLAQGMRSFTGALTEACLRLDETAVQGVIKPTEAADIKEVMLKALVVVFVQKGLVEKPANPFVPPQETLGYKPPKCFMLREPRPWTLPGWKHPYKLKEEFDAWLKLKEEKAQAKAQALQA